MSFTSQEPTSPLAGAEGTEFWKDLPDDVLEDFYQQLDNRAEGQELLDESWRLQSQGTNGNTIALDSSAALIHLKTEGGGSNPLTLSQTGVLQPATQLQLQFPTFNQVAATQQRVRARSVIDQAIQLIQQQEQQIAALKQTQLSIASDKDERIRDLQDQQQKLAQQIEQGLKELRQLQIIQVLEVDDLHQTRNCIARLALQQVEVELLKQELQQLSTNAAPSCIAAVVITEQSPPQVIFKSKFMEDAYGIQLLLAPSVEIQTVSKVKAKIVSDEPNWKVDNPIENDEVNLDLYHKSAKFNQFKIHVSTRMSMVRLKFQVLVTPKKGTAANVVSEASSPFIVITNESQWCEAAGRLIQDDAFGGQAEIPWPQFANTFHVHFLKATRQDMAKPQRALSPLDFHFIHTKFFNGTQTVTTQAAQAFWAWFGPVTQTLRFKRHINSLWFTGIIHGIITKEECNMALMNQELGTFMIRFSENYPGLFAIAYVSDDPYERVKHYLVKPEDTGSQKTLPDFLREKSQFQKVYQYDHHTGMLRCYPKDEVLDPYYNKKYKHDNRQGDNGYVLL